jgi:hypothetical protein
LLSYVTGSVIQQLKASVFHLCPSVAKKLSHVVHKFQISALSAAAALNTIVPAFGLAVLSTNNNENQPIYRFSTSRRGRPLDGLPSHHAVRFERARA